MGTDKRHRRGDSNDWLLWVLMAACVAIASVVYVAFKAKTGDAVLSLVLWAVVSVVLCLVVRAIWTQLDRFKGKRLDEAPSEPSEPSEQTSDKVLPGHESAEPINAPHTEVVGDTTENTIKEEPVISPEEPLSANELERREAYRIRDLVDGLDKTFVSTLPEELQRPEALFALVMFRDAGYLDECFMPVAEPGKTDIHRTNYSFIAAALGCALGLSNKWQVFQRAWGIKNMRNLYEKIKKPDMSAATPYEIDVVNLLREARRLNPKLATEDLHYFINKCPADHP